MENYNAAINTSFKFFIDKSPELTYFVQNVVFPNVSVNAQYHGIRNNIAKIPGNVVNYSDLILTFLVDEDFNNYDTLYAWLLESRDATDSGPKIKKMMSDISLFRLNSNKVTIAEIKYKDAFPVDIGTFSYVTNGSDPDVLVCDVTFAFQTFEIQKRKKV